MSRDGTLDARRRQAYVLYSFFDMVKMVWRRPDECCGRIANPSPAASARGFRAQGYAPAV